MVVRTCLWLLLLSGCVAPAASVAVDPQFALRVERLDATPVRDGDNVVWVNQAVRVSVQVDSDTPFARLRSDPARQPGIEIVELPQLRGEPVHEEVQAGTRRTRYRVGWMLYPQSPGAMTVRLPTLDYLRDGVVTHRFEPAGIDLEVRVLPAYVPPTLPVGRMDVEVVLPERRFLLRHELAFLDVRIVGDGPPGHYLSGVLRQFRSDDSITFYPPEPDAASDAVRVDGRSVSRYRIPFAATRMGVLALPALRLQAFDPATGKIETRRLEPGRFVAAAPWVVYAAAGSLSLGALWLTGSVYRAVRRQWRIHSAYRAAVCGLRCAETPEALKSALMEIAAAESWPANLSLAAWLHHWIGRYPERAAIAADILCLQERLYGRGQVPVAELGARLIARCQRRQPLSKWFP